MNEEQLNPEDQFLRELFRKSTKLPDPSLRAQIMSSIEKKPTFEYQPVISTKMWWFISSVFTSTIGYLLFFYQSNDGKPYFDMGLPNDGFSRLANRLNAVRNIFERISIQLPEVSIMVLAVLSALMLIGVSFVFSYRSQIVRSSQ